jgi:hypothetical protein
MVESSETQQAQSQLLSEAQLMQTVEAQTGATRADYDAWTQVTATIPVPPEAARADPYKAIADWKKATTEVQRTALWKQQEYRIKYLAVMWPAYWELLKQHVGRRMAEALVQMRVDEFWALSVAEAEERLDGLRKTPRNPPSEDEPRIAAALAAREAQSQPVNVHDLEAALASQQLGTGTFIVYKDAPTEFLSEEPTTPSALELNAQRRAHELAELETRKQVIAADEPIDLPLKLEALLVMLGTGAFRP